ncbi:MAG: S8 family serine peptidase [Bacteroidia bacterium]|nr:S8 family serine peptidase [Bacteroidia bacterium]
MLRLLFYRTATKACFALMMILFSIQALADKYWISFSDKNHTTFDPYAYFDSKAIERRLLQHIPLSDSTDFPVNESYITAVRNLSDSVSWESRWLNGVAAYVNASNLGRLKALPFIKDIVRMEAHTICAGNNQVIWKSSSELKALLKYQTERMQGGYFTGHNIDGRGIRIAVLDAGFPEVDKHPAFKKLRDEHRIIDTYDFVSRKKYVYDHHWHGTATLSCIVGIKNGTPVGLATGAEVLLARTERTMSELESEEEFWLAAAEWADKNGADIISSSLGYTTPRYFNSDMNGRKSLVARAATIAAAKGILVVNAAGNEGDNNWRFIDTPGDADSVFTVGGTDPYTDMHIGFSSFGPTSDGRLKPNACAPGMAVVAKGRGYTIQSGTSFSTPLVAGFAACAWQEHRSLTNMQLFQNIEKASHLYPYFDYAHGYGIPLAGHLDSVTIHEPTFDFVIVNDHIKVVLREKYSYPADENSMGYNGRRNFYYKIEDASGAMRSYYVLLASQKEILDFYAEDFAPGDQLTVHFEGFTQSLEVLPEENK